jgi:iron complex transport system substrate-binding protein
MRSLTLPTAITLFAAAATAQTIEQPHARGVATFEATPQTVVVFDLASLDILDALGVRVAAAPGGLRPAYLDDAAGDAPIGTLFEPDMEAVAALAPDLIIVGGRSAPQYDALSALGPTIDLTVEPTNQMQAVRDNTLSLGRLFGREAEAEALIAELDAEIAATREAAADSGPALIVLTTGGRMSAHGPQGRFAALFNDFGVQSAVAQLDPGTHGQSISYEFILQTNPDWLFVLDRDAAIGRDGTPARALLDNPLVAQTTAWREGNVAYVAGERWYLVGAGVQAMRMNAIEVREALEARKGG